MKKIGILTLLAAFILQGFSQEVTATNRTEKQVIDTTEVSKVAIGDDLLVIEKNEDLTRIKVRDRGMAILESLEGLGPKVKFENYSEERDEETFRRDEDEHKEPAAKKRSRFRGHWAGIEAGLNNYTLSDYSLTLPDEINYMTLHSGKSRNLNLNFGQLSIGLGRHIGFVTGFGLSWNNYRFDGNNNIQKDVNNITTILDPGEPLKKSKFSTFFFKVPLLLEFQIPTDRQRLNISAGPVGAIKLGSYSSMVFEDKEKVKSDDDFNLNMLRYGATARIGYENITVYGTYYLTPLFKEGKGPGGVDLFPFEIGIAFTIDD
ncbi:MAG TPA: outer membrane beta-barrel protein [Bacteroidales bacterium]|nr:outer membrane beta-barrel protein [Bacteroidales bacterium]HPJ59342.1 outer membrane beta-barrel protein [Bacteroidales bacterium]HPR13223.1 outer membrane beta-barrel protein [Bacteroidales bacterium]HRW85644.1 outer membrane beta-barrel protein [Bacteroidales bacterium]